MEPGPGQDVERVEELDDRPRPPVGEDEWQSVSLRGAGVEEADPQPIDGGPILADGAESLLARSPVVGLRPVAAQLLQVGQRDALGGVGLRLWPPSGAEARPQVPQLLIGDNGRERLHHGIILAHDPRLLALTPPQPSLTATPPSAERSSTGKSCLDRIAAAMSQPFSPR